ncbi:MAG: OmpA family protein [Bacteroidota bacterium]
MRFLYTYFTFCLLLAVPVSLIAQDEEEKDILPNSLLKQEALMLRDTASNEFLFLEEEEEYSSFTTDITPGYFQNERAFKVLMEFDENIEGATADGAAHLQQMETYLEGYINRFQIDNFQTDIQLIWMLGRVKQLNQKYDEAVFYYELAKTHGRGRDIKKLRIDSVISGPQSEWLPINQYYELLKVRAKIDTLYTPVDVLTNMGDFINSNSPDYAPFMHPTDSILIFTSRRDTSGMDPSDIIDPFSRHNEDLYYASIDIFTGEWGMAERLADQINTEYNEGSACLSPDGKTLYFTRCHPFKGEGDCDIYSAEYDPTDGTWSHVKNLGRNINSKAWDSQPNISADGEYLFFVSNRNGGFGGTDIYVAFWDSTSKSFGPAQNLGPLINTPNHEVTPFFHRINSTLYFSSTGHLFNYGGYDIFKARQVGRSWEQPKNVGPLVNTLNNEYYFSIDGAGETIFYSKSEDDVSVDHVKQNFDLYSFPMPMEARPDAIVKLEGELIDSVTGNKLVGIAMIVPLDDTIEVAPKKIKDGYFEFELIGNKRYRLYIMGPDFLTISNDFRVEGDTTFSVLTESFEQNKPIVFEALKFGKRSDKLKTIHKPKLDYIVEFLQRYPQFKLEIEGHTDSDGDAIMNKNLSQRRAEAIRGYLLKKGGFEEEKIAAIGYGEARPIVPNNNDSLKAINRRVEFKLVLDASFTEDYVNPTEAELKFNDDLEAEYDPEFEDEFDWSDEERSAWEEELELEDEDDLAKELEREILKSKFKDVKKKKKPSGGTTPR